MIDIVKVRFLYVELNRVMMETFSLAFSGASNWSWKFWSSVILFLIAMRRISWAKFSIRPRANNQRGDSGKLNLRDKRTCM